MSDNTTFIGYSGLIWRTIYNAVADYMNNSISPAALARDPALALSISQTMLRSIYNAVDAINAFDYGVAWQAMDQVFLYVNTLPLAGLDVPTATFFVNRTVGYNAAYPALQAIVPQGPFDTPANTLEKGIPIIPDVNLLEFYQGFAYETQPAGLTNVNFAAQAQACADAMQNITNALIVFQGLYPTQAVSLMQQQTSIAQVVASTIAGLQSGTVASNIGVTQAWNQIVALPSFTMTGSTLSTAPYSKSAQQSAVIRYALLNLAKQICVFLLSLQRPSTQQISTAIIRIGDTLMDIAARELGNFDRWIEIATLNNLQPPWIGPLTTETIAGWGTKLIMPGPGTTAAAGGQKISYSQDFLGTDLYIGPINGSMPAWNGDFQTITGINNLSWALGRRLQTAMGTLIYHRTYGSRIPAEIGQVQDSQTASHIKAYGTSALMSDPRVQAVLSATIGIPAHNQISFQGVVKPIGDQTARANANEVILGAGA